MFLEPNAAHHHRFQTHDAILQSNTTHSCRSDAAECQHVGKNGNDVRARAKLHKMMTESAHDAASGSPLLHRRSAKRWDQHVDYHVQGNREQGQISTVS